ncbi:gamma carbonic anhydrase family protein [Tuwongella immobilis]|uniref:Gamma carbonic anhydrase family protein n=1 Tax=Tuwongella immobilis TaxID=692036 RepID=A0A6C2YMQ2_9BACT|nr:gamma carbonic anhydrase family protein [Tuwongella immobilis]VIP02716.1 Uncharacterized protein OS=Beijerinckia indica subsp. indica (strain ATCC 9039 / DSM 1715 / NCIB 8712) GN=Bind_2096 PE=4 SV=1: Hexapep [Tuwongella immobilis]VTS02239.1 Uncharacterized protein OS=Beijerinckia indica subsp. indica (strain ATCC 9039 / DSM 1715 / NCIB 8712) GN=Bind_2096 PE=4 SV=1: Hexapep [Tuwongella immobilis]
MRKIGLVYLAENVVVTGDTRLDAGVNLWFGTVIRGDLATIHLAENVNIQDGCVLHTDFDVSLTLEPGVVVGHSAVIHGTRIGAGSLIAMGARVLSGVELGEECIVAAGAVVPEGKRFPPRSMIMGIPGKVVREVREEEIARVRMINQRYRELAQRYVDGEMAWPYGKPST